MTRGEVICPLKPQNPSENHNSVNNKTDAIYFLITLARKGNR